MTTPDPSLFLVNRRVGEYEADFDIRGTVTVCIKAPSLEAANDKADDMCDDDEFGIELDQVDDARRTRVRKTPAMYLVTRDGQEMQVSRLREGDTPRHPSEHEARELARQDAAPVSA